MQWQRADGVRQNQFRGAFIQSAQYQAIRVAGKKTVVVYALPAQLAQHFFCNGVCAKLQCRCINAPVQFDRAREVGERIDLQPHTTNTQLLCFDQRGARSAKRIKHRIRGLESELIQVPPHQMRWIGKHKAVPVMRRAVERV